jgi:hypothetical protein
MAIYASLLRYIQTINWTGYQGRLAFAAAASIAMFIALGLVALGGKRLAMGIAGGLLTLAVAALLLLLFPAYPRPTIYQPGQELTRTCARFDGGLQVEAVGSGSRTAPGGFLPVTIFGYGLADTAQPQMMSVRLLGANGQDVGQATAELAWHAGEVVAAVVDVPVAEGALPARAVLDLAMVGENGRNQTATSATGRALDIPVRLETVKITSPEVLSPSPQFKSTAIFGEQLVLIGYDVEKDDDGPAIILYWQVRERMAADYTTFVHILDEEGQIVAQDDSQPTDGIYPTSIWDKGEIVADRKEMDLAEEAIDNELTVVTGVYLLETLERLAVWDASGQRQPGDQWPLDQVTP